ARARFPLDADGADTNLEDVSKGGPKQELPTRPLNPLDLETLLTGRQVTQSSHGCRQSPGVPETGSDLLLASPADQQEGLLLVLVGVRVLGDMLQSHRQRICGGDELCLR